MRVVPFATVDEVSWDHPRTGEVRTRRFLEGENGSPNNFILHFHHSIDSFATPRHRHNFEQVRYHLEGVERFPGYDAGPGIVGYFPEATYYGPHSDSGNTMFAVLQWGGDPGYVSHHAI